MVEHNINIQKAPDIHEIKTLLSSLVLRGGGNWETEDEKRILDCTGSIGAILKKAGLYVSVLKEISDEEAIDAVEAVLAHSNNILSFYKELAADNIPVLSGFLPEPSSVTLRFSYDAPDEQEGDFRYLNASLIAAFECPRDRGIPGVSWIAMPKARIILEYVNGIRYLQISIEGDVCAVSNAGRLLTLRSGYGAGVWFADISPAVGGEDFSFKDLTTLLFGSDSANVPQELRPVAASIESLPKIIQDAMREVKLGRLKLHFAAEGAYLQSLFLRLYIKNINLMQDGALVLDEVILDVANEASKTEEQREVSRSSCITLVGKARINTLGQSEKFSLMVRRYGSGAQSRWELGLPPDETFSLNSLGAMIALADKPLGQTVDKTLADIGRITVTRLLIGFQFLDSKAPVSSDGFSSFTFAANAAGSWKVFDKLVVKSVAVDLELTKSGGGQGAAWAFNGVVEGKAVFGALPVFARISVRSGRKNSYSANLYSERGSPLKLGALLGQIAAVIDGGAPSQDGPIKELSNIDVVDMEAAWRQDDGRNHFWIGCALVWKSSSQDWLKSARFSIAAAYASSGLTGQIDGAIDFHNSLLTLSLTLKAEKETSVAFDLAWTADKDAKVAIVDVVRFFVPDIANTDDVGGVLKQRITAFGGRCDLATGALELELKLGDARLALKIAKDKRTQKTAVIFDGEISCDLKLNDLFSGFGDTGQNFAGMLPADIAVSRLAIAVNTGSSLAHVGVGLKISGKDLTFALLRERPEKKGEQSAVEPAVATVAGFEYAQPIALASVAGNSELIQKLLGGVEIDGLSLSYANADHVTKRSLFQIGTDKTAKDDAKKEKKAPKGGKDQSDGAHYKRGLDFQFKLRGPDGDAPLTLGEAKPPPTTEPAKPSDGPKPAPAISDSPASWTDINKALGPLLLKRVGVEFKDKKLGVLLDSSVELAGLKVGLTGLAVRLDSQELLKGSLKDIAFGLDGLELGFSRGPITIGGALIRTKADGVDVFTGAARIGASKWTVSAIGSYTTVNGKPSMFVFGAYHGLIGGVPAFMVEGVAAGFGYNRALVLPSIDEVHSFPLVKMLSASGALDPDPLALAKYFPPADDSYWVAAGIKFNSFKLVNGVALVTVLFGARFEIALLGTALFEQPPRLTPDIKPLVKIEMAIKVRLTPDEGVFTAEARLTENSYLFDADCRLTGGFAFYLWFKPTRPGIEDRSGDFVLTLGGYHPRFKVPAHYPKNIDRVGLKWALPKWGINIEGGLYFALTPSYIMAGGRLVATYRSGAVEAWFDAQYDFLMQWDPLVYQADARIRIGARASVTQLGVTICLSVEVGAVLAITGPPFYGVAVVDAGISSFTVRIGDPPKDKPQRLDWSKFSGKYLGAAPLTTAITAGTVRDVMKDKNGRELGPAVVNPADLRLTVNTKIPATSVEIDGKKSRANVTLDKKPSGLGIRPMEIANLGSDIVVRLARANGDPVKGVVAKPTLLDVPEALWSPEAAKTPTGSFESRLIAGAYSGLELRPPAATESKAITVPTTVVKTKDVHAPAAPRPTFDHGERGGGDATPPPFYPDNNILTLLENAGFGAAVAGRTTRKTEDPAVGFPVLNARTEVRGLDAPRRKMGAHR